MKSTHGSANGMSASSADVGVYAEPQYATTIDVDVGLHHASPPPSNCGYSPWWISCENFGTPRLTVFPFIDVALGKVLFMFVRLETTALYRVAVGVAVDPARRSSVSRNRYATAG